MQVGAAVFVAACQDPFDLSGDVLGVEAGGRVNMDCDAVALAEDLRRGLRHRERWGRLRALCG